MKLCMYVGYHDANNMSNFGGDPITFFKKRFIILFTLFYGYGAPQQRRLYWYGQLVGHQPLVVVCVCESVQRHVAILHGA